MFFCIGITNYFVDPYNLFRNNLDNLYVFSYDRDLIPTVLKSVKNKQD